MIDNLIKKYKENIIECERVIKAYQHTEKMKYIHHGMKQASKEFIQDLEKLKEPTICGYSVEEVITILNGLELERKLDMKMTMDNLSLLAEKIHKDFANSIEKTLKKTCILGVDRDE